MTARRINFKWSTSEYKDYIILEDMNDVFDYIEANTKVAKK